MLLISAASTVCCPSNLPPDLFRIMADRCAVDSRLLHHFLRCETAEPVVGSVCLNTALSWFSSGYSLLSDDFELSHFV